MNARYHFFLKYSKVSFGKEVNILLKIKKNSVLNTLKVFLFSLLLMIPIRINAEEIYYRNYNNIIMTEEEYNNLLNLGFQESDIYLMDEEEFLANHNLKGIVVSEKINYYVVTNIYEGEKIKNSNIREITKEEYDNFEPKNISLFSSIDGVVESYGKTVRTSITSTGNGYRFKVNSSWKYMPSTRSIDVMSLTLDSTKLGYSNVVFKENYCLSTGECDSSSVVTLKKQESGVGAAYQLPTNSNLTLLNSYLYYDVNKKVNTLTEMIAYGDYAHAGNIVNSSTANNYFVEKDGIHFFGDSNNCYDEISPAQARWVGIWQ